MLTSKSLKLILSFIMCPFPFLSACNGMKTYKQNNLYKCSNKADALSCSFCSEIPKLSLFPPDSEDAESPTNQDTLEGDQINNLSKHPSSSQLYDQVLQSCAYKSPQLKKCPCCGHHQPITGNVCLNQTNAPSHSDCSTSAVKAVHRCSPFHQPMCHNTMQCHWLQGSCDGSNYKPVQHHVVTVRSKFFLKCSSD